MTIPQVVGMYKNDRTRKEILVDFGFRLPSALDNRPLTFEEFEATVNQAVYMSATPGRLRARAQRADRRSSSSGRPGSSTRRSPSARPRARSTTSSSAIRERVERGERVLVTTLTKQMAEDLADYLRELGVKVQYLHSEVDTLERVRILRDLRLGVYDVLVGINLLREGIDLPEVTLVAILDADKEGFLRSAWSLIQMIGRAARNIGGEVVMYADTITESMRAAIEETDRRRGDPGALQRASTASRRSRSSRRSATSTTGCGSSPSPRGRTAATGGSATSAGREPKAQVEQLVAPPGGGDAGRRPGARVRAGGGAARRGPADPAAGPRGGRVGRSWAAPPRRPRAHGRRPPAARAAGRARARTPATPVLEVTEVTVVPAGEEPRPTVDEGTAADWLPGIRDEHEDDDAAGRRAGSIGRPGIARSPRTSAAAPVRRGPGADRRRAYVRSVGARPLRAVGLPEVHLPARCVRSRRQWRAGDVPSGCLPRANACAPERAGSQPREVRPAGLGTPRRPREADAIVRRLHTWQAGDAARRGAGHPMGATARPAGASPSILSSRLDRVTNQRSGPSSQAASCIPLQSPDVAPSASGPGSSWPIGPGLGLVGTADAVDDRLVAGARRPLRPSPRGCIPSWSRGRRPSRPIRSRRLRLVAYLEGRPGDRRPDVRVPRRRSPCAA